MYNGRFWIDGGAFADFSSGQATPGARFAIGWTAFGVEVQRRRFEVDNLGAVLSCSFTVSIPYSWAAGSFGLPRLPGGGLL